MRALGFDLPKHEIVSILQEHGVTSENSALSKTSSHPTRLFLPLKQFQNIMAQRIAKRDPKEEILRAFRLFDDGGKGKIDLQDLQRVARELGESLGEEELAAMIDEFDLDGDNAIDEDEFVAICLQ